MHRRARSTIASGGLVVQIRTRERTQRRQSSSARSRSSTSYRGKAVIEEVGQSKAAKSQGRRVAPRRTCTRTALGGWLSFGQRMAFAWLTGVLETTNGRDWRRTTHRRVQHQNK
ncbi:hypothetical protein BV20DRAFT_240458 [Pilatotrama ljubarskyi]|nr:hypothetical protein BV20DRAFT_240458 [Pilatotrama ljubarskyi]